MHRALRYGKTLGWVLELNLGVTDSNLLQYALGTCSSSTATSSSLQGKHIYDSLPVYMRSPMVDMLVQF